MTKEEFIQQFVINAAQYIVENDNIDFWAKMDNDRPQDYVIREADLAWEFIKEHCNDGE